jgi:predicted XRE-type DNA-binding protein
MRKKTKEDSSIFFEVIEQAPEKSKNHVIKSLEIVNQINHLLKERSINQKILADKLEKTQAEVSKWLSGTHNFTVRTITAIETVLQAEIIVTPLKVKSNPLQYTTRTYRGSLNEKNAKVNNAEKYNVKSKSSQVPYQLAA